MAQTKTKRAIYMCTYHKAHREEEVAYREAHREEKAASQHTWYEVHREEQAAYKRAYNLTYRKAHREEIAASKRAYMRAYYKAHREEALARSAAWREAHQEEHAAYSRAWGKAHPEKRAEARRRRRALERGATIGPIDLAAIKLRDRMLCAICGKKVAAKDLSFDHTIPLVLGGPHSQENLRVAHRRCNSRRNVGYLPVQMVLTVTKEEKRE